MSRGIPFKVIMQIVSELATYIDPNSIDHLLVYKERGEYEDRQIACLRLWRRDEYQITLSSMATVALICIRSFSSLMSWTPTSKADSTKFAAAQAEALVKGLENTDLSGIYPSKIEPEDPASYDNKVGELILEEMARRIAKNQAKGINKEPRVVNRMKDGKRHVLVIEEVVIKPQS